jgi:ribosome-associated toxin RatA of RatAB toxin-antitoxin module
MAKFEASVMVDHPAEVVWKSLTDLSSFKKWDPYCLEARQTSTGPFGLGTTFQLRRSNTPKNPNFRVIEYETNRKVSLEFLSGPVRGTTQQFSVEAIEGKAKLTRSFDLKYSGFYKLLGPFLTGSVKRQTEADLDNTKRMLESEAKS